mmetsp:Transcript_10339/g.19560  ORF Transcript_10339/g.19560 Transcript_10339/m.19560 type:complete len:205 (+) Transcript_10339:3519-4133(+)
MISLGTIDGSLHSGYFSLMCSFHSVTTFTKVCSHIVGIFGSLCFKLFYQLQVLLCIFIAPRLFSVQIFVETRNGVLVVLDLSFELCFGDRKFIVMVFVESVELCLVLFGSQLHITFGDFQQLANLHFFRFKRSLHFVKVCQSLFLSSFQDLNLAGVGSQRRFGRFFVGVELLNLFSEFSLCFFELCLEFLNFQVFVREVSLITL